MYYQFLNKNFRSVFLLSTLLSTAVLGFNTSPDLVIHADGNDGEVNWSNQGLLGNSFVFALDFTVTSERIEANKGYSLITFTNNYNNTDLTFNLTYNFSNALLYYTITGNSDPRYHVRHLAYSSFATIYVAYDSISGNAHLYACSDLVVGYPSIEPMIQEVSSSNFDFWNGSNTTITLGSDDFFDGTDDRSLAFVGYDSSSFGENGFDAFYNNLKDSRLSAAELTEITAIPEPRFYGMLTGLVVLLTVIYIRRNKA